MAMRHTFLPLYHRLRKKGTFFSWFKKGLSTSSVLEADDKKRPRSVRLSCSVFESTEHVSNDKTCPVVIVHGIYESKSNWRHLAKVILTQTGQKVITADLRNHGESPHHSDFNFEVMKDDVLSLLDEMRIPKAVLVGHSMGGRVMMSLALSQPEYVEKLVVVDVSPLTASSKANILYKFIDATKNMQLPSGISLSEARKRVNLDLVPVIESPAIRHFYASNIEERPDKSYKWKANIDALNANMMMLLDFPSYTTSYSGPTLFIGGGKSDYLRREEHDIIKERLFPKAEFRYIPDAGHWVHSDKPKEFLQVLCSFLNDNVTM